MLLFLGPYRGWGWLCWMLLSVQAPVLGQEPPHERSPLAPLPPPGVLFLNDELHGLVVGEWFDPALALPMVHTLEQFRQRTGALQVAPHGLIEKILRAALLPGSTTQLLQ